MLNKTICSKCYFGGFKNISDNFKNLVEEEFHHQWDDNEKVYCHLGNGVVLENKTKDKPHERCTYVLEHLVTDNLFS